MKHLISELFLLWVETGKNKYTKEKTAKAARETLEGISKKCPNFPAKPQISRKHVPFYRQTMFRVAAVIVPLLIVGVTLGLLQINTPKGEYLKQNITRTTIIIKAIDEDKLVEMPDGSTIRLEEGAILEYQSNFTENRVVKLNGAAFFNVAKMSGESFEVDYDEINVRVLGTEFYVCRYNEATEVTLCSGSVEVSSANYKVVLEPHQQFSIDDTGANYTVVKLNEKDIARVYHGPLRFKDTPLREALQQTGRYFGVHIDTSTVRNTEPVRMKASIHDSLEDVLYMLQLVSNKAFIYHIDGEEISIETN